MITAVMLVWLHMSLLSEEAQDWLSGGPFATTLSTQHTSPLWLCPHSAPKPMVVLKVQVDVTLAGRSDQAACRGGGGQAWWHDWKRGRHIGGALRPGMAAFRF